jgi:hypothetical protein
MDPRSLAGTSPFSPLELNIMPIKVTKGGPSPEYLASVRETHRILAELSAGRIPKSCPPVMLAAIKSFPRSQAALDAVTTEVLGANWRDDLARKSDPVPGEVDAFLAQYCAAMQPDERARFKRDYLAQINAPAPAAISSTEARVAKIFPAFTREQIAKIANDIDNKVPPEAA